MFGSLTHGFFNFQVFGCKEYIILLGRDKVMLNHACMQSSTLFIECHC
jgi:hypothetical protein